MLVAHGLDGRRVVAAAELRGAELSCPRCSAPVIVRCGKVLVAHFAHRAGECSNPIGRRTRSAGGGAPSFPDQPTLFDALEEGDAPTDASTATLSEVTEDRTWPEPAHAALAAST